MSSGLVAIFSWKTRKNSTNGSMGNKKFAKKIFCHTPSVYTCHICLIAKNKPAYSSSHMT